MTGPNIFGLREYSRKDLFECTTDEIRDADRFYIMHEADKVIADLKQKIKQLDVLLDKALNTISESHKHVVSLARKCNHANYKRCLYKAKLCESEEKRLEAIAPIFDTDKECWEYNSDYWYKWRERWLKIAEQFKETK